MVIIFMKQKIDMENFDCANLEMVIKTLDFLNNFIFKKFDKRRIVTDIPNSKTWVEDKTFFTQYNVLYGGQPITITYETETGKNFHIRADYSPIIDSKVNSNSEFMRELTNEELKVQSKYYLDERLQLYSTDKNNIGKYNKPLTLLNTLLKDVDKKLKHRKDLPEIDSITTNSTYFENFDPIEVYVGSKDI